METLDTSTPEHSSKNPVRFSEVSKKDCSEISHAVATPGCFAKELSRLATCPDPCENPFERQKYP